MSDSYQATYDAVRSRISGGDVSQAVRDWLGTQDFSYAVQGLVQDIAGHFAEYSRPSAVYKPRLFIDGDHWCALYGENLQEGVAGFGHCPDEAMREFDRNWFKGIVK